MCNPGAASIPFFESHGIRVIQDPLERKFSLKTISNIRTALREGGYDILHLYTNTAISNGAIAAIGLPVKVVAYRGQTGNTGRWDPTSYLGILHPRIDMVVGVAQAVTDYVREQQFSGGRAETVYKGHDLNWYSNPRADLSGLNLPPDAVIVSLIADLRPRKGLQVLVEATHHLDPAAKIRILLVGAEPDNPAVIDHLSAAANPAAILALGYRSDAPEVSAASDIIVLPTTKREGLSRAVIEGMAYGRPAVVTDTGGNAELVKDGETGLVVPANDAKALGEALSREWDTARRDLHRNRDRIRRAHRSGNLRSGEWDWRRVIIGSRSGRSAVVIDRVFHRDRRVLHCGFVHRDERRKRGAIVVAQIHRDGESDAGWIDRSASDSLMNDR